MSFYIYTEVDCDCGIRVPIAQGYCDECIEAFTAPTLERV